MIEGMITVAGRAQHIDASKVLRHRMPLAASRDSDFSSMHGLGDAADLVLQNGAADEGPASSVTGGSPASSLAGEALRKLVEEGLQPSWASRVAPMHSGSRVLVQVDGRDNALLQRTYRPNMRLLMRFSLRAKDEPSKPALAFTPFVPVNSDGPTLSNSKVPRSNGSSNDVIDT